MKGKLKSKKMGHSKLLDCDTGALVGQAETGQTEVSARGGHEMGSRMKGQEITVLLVENSTGDAKLVRDALAGSEGKRFHLSCVDRLETGLEQLARGGVDVVLIDLPLSDSRGLDIFTGLHAQSPDVPIIVLTNLKDEAFVMAVVRESGQGYLVKEQVDGSLLARSLHNAVERQRPITDLRQQAQELQSSEARFRNIITTDADGIIVVDRNGIVRFVNPAAQALFGRKAGELVGSFFGFPVVAGETTELDIIRRDEGKAVAEMRVVATEWDREAVYLASLRDITQHKRLLAELEQLRQEQLRAKNQFLSRVSHELRSPLAAIHQFVTILLDGLADDLSSEQGEYLEIVLRNVNQLRTMVGDLQKVTRAETGRLTIEPQYVSLTELISEMLKMFGMANTKDMLLSGDIPSDLPPVYADPDRVQQILRNLLDNAIKFTPENGTVTVRVQISEQDPGFLCVAVADSGCGVKAEESEVIFEYLYQAENNMEAGRKGLGLSLYICKELVSRHGGRIWVESQPECGSTFFFTLPIFSLVRQLTPILTKRNLMTGSMALITVEVFPVEKRLLTKTDEAALREAWNVLQHCILPNLDVLLPRMPPRKLGETFFIVACADRNGVEVLVRRIREQLLRCEGLQDAGLDSAVSFTMLDVPSRRDAEPSEELVKDIANSMEDLMSNSLLPKEELT